MKNLEEISKNVQHFQEILNFEITVEFLKNCDEILDKFCRKIKPFEKIQEKIFMKLKNMQYIRENYEKIHKSIMKISEKLEEKRAIA